MKTENSITFRIKARYYLDFVTPETIKLNCFPKSKITKDENGKNAPK